MSCFEPNIIAFFCQWCAYAAADAVGRAHLVLPSGLKEVRVMCSGRVDPQFILQAFANGADGVVVLGCLPGNCHYKNGNIMTQKRVAMLKTALPSFGIDPKRLHLAFVASDDPAGLVDLITQATDTVRQLGPLRACATVDGL